jgi:uncharacterized protein (TIRG00374 family)
VSTWIRVALLGLGLVILAGFVVSVDLAAIASAASRADLDRLAVALALLAANVAMKAVRWRVMARSLSEHPLGLRAASAAILAGVAAASLTPGRGVELAKPLLLRSSHGVPMASSTAAVIVERLLDGAALIVLFAASVALVPAARGSTFYPVVAAVALFLTAGAILLLMPHRLAAVVTWVTVRLPIPAHLQSRAASIVSRFAGSLAIWRESGRLGSLLALSIAAAVLEVLRLAAVLAALRLSVSVAMAGLAFSAANLLATLTFIPGGIGITELSLTGIIGLVAAVGPPAAVAAAILLDRVLSYYLIVAIGGLILVMASRRWPSEHQNAPEGR